MAATVGQPQTGVYVRIRANSDKAAFSFDTLVPVAISHCHEFLAVWRLPISLEPEISVEQEDPIGVQEFEAEISQEHWVERQFRMTLT